MVAALAGVVVLGACGIRPTEVPTDFGAAPSRLPCTLDDDGPVPPASGELPVRVYLVCGPQLVEVDRTVRAVADLDTTGGRVRLAQRLLGELLARPGTAERAAGFVSGVRDGTTVSGPRAGDPAGTLRLSVPPDDLGDFGLAQVVCTFARSAAATTDGEITLGGPATATHTYRCTPALRKNPSAQLS
ncbi:hypothetical protein [Streptomyces sp. NPDC007088]|uniref:hypothetical protein n=1 Tax=Streptomyces sp. NPDC007088 TaxID=3364773 RepID=UPI0036A54983